MTPMKNKFETVRCKNISVTKFDVIRVIMGQATAELAVALR
jgi:hypothetical protein